MQLSSIDSTDKLYELMFSEFIRSWLLWRVVKRFGDSELKQLSITKVKIWEKGKATY